MKTSNQHFSVSGLIFVLIFKNCVLFVFCVLFFGA